MAIRAMAKVLDRSLFTKKLQLLALRIPSSECKSVVSNFKKFLLNKPRISNVAQDEDKSKRLILLKEDLQAVPEELRAQVPGAEAIKHEVLLDYDYWPADHVLRELLPAEVDVPSSFETVGHIAHLNLRDQHLPYKHLIGQVILDKNPSIKTVVNKLDNINTTFRTFAMEVLAGIDEFNVEVKESNCTFKFNYAEVYWNSRLQTEHDRLVRSFSATSVICDMFAGVGPFSIPAAKKCAMVHANDLNPQSVKYLVENAKLNKVQPHIQTYNLDARDFVKKLVRDDHVKIDHVIMNLPASAVQFLDAFADLYPAGTPSLPCIHCYGFSKAEDPRADIVRQIEAVIGRQLTNPHVYEVRNVAPKKYMFCVSFTLPAADAPAISSTRDIEQSPPNKRRKLNNGDTENTNLSDLDAK